MEDLSDILSETFSDTFTDHFREDFGDDQSLCRDQSPGENILSSIDKHLPPLSSRKLSITANCLVEDLSLIFPSISITLKLATAGSNEVFIPTICDLALFNSKDIGLYSKNCTRIPDNVVLDGTVKDEEWYRAMLEEITTELERYTMILPITVGNMEYANGEIKVIANTDFEIQPGEKQKIFTNFRLPSYGVRLTAKSKYSLRKQMFCSYETNSVSEMLEESGEHFPSVRAAFPVKGKIKCSNKDLLDWVNRWLPEELSDYCFEGIFSTQEGERLKLTILNKTESTITIKKGEEIALLVL